MNPVFSVFLSFLKEPPAWFIFLISAVVVAHFFAFLIKFLSLSKKIFSLPIDINKLHFFITNIIMLFFGAFVIIHQILEPALREENSKKWFEHPLFLLTYFVFYAWVTSKINRPK